MHLKKQLQQLAVDFWKDVCQQARLDNQCNTKSGVCILTGGTDAVVVSAMGCCDLCRGQLANTDSFWGLDGTELQQKVKFMGALVTHLM